MADNSLSYFSSLESPHSRVQVTPAYQPPESSHPVDNVATAGNFTAQTSESDTDPSNRTLQADKLSLSNAAEQLTTEDLRLIQALSQRDREVRAHEAAHLAAAGRYAGSGANFTYQRGPNGVSYAIGGEVSLDTSTPSDPQQALAKAQQIRAAALAPAQPSGQDRAVAAQATQAATQAKANIASERAKAATETAEQLQGDGVEPNNPQGADEAEGVAEGKTTQPSQNGILEYRNNVAADSPDTKDRNLSLSLEA